MPHCIAAKVDIVPILPEIRALFGSLGYNIAAYDDDTLTDAVLTVCPVVSEGWPTNEQIELVLKTLTGGGARARR